MRYLGYEAPVTTVFGVEKVQGVAFQLGVNDGDRLLTDREQQIRSLGVEKLLEGGHPVDPGMWGTHGESVLFKILPYVDRNMIWAPPFYHMVMLGCVKGLMCIIVKGDEKKDSAVAKFKLKNKKQIEALESNFLLTGDLGRPYEPLELCRSYLIEHVVRYLEIYSVFLFNAEVTGVQVLTPLAKQAWGYLRRGIQHFHRLDKEVTTDDELAEWELSRQKARQELLEYGKIMEKVRFVILICLFFLP